MEYTQNSISVGFHEVASWDISFVCFTGMVSYFYNNWQDDLRSDFWSLEKFDILLGKVAQMWTFCVGRVRCRVRWGEGAKDDRRMYRHTARWHLIRGPIPDTCDGPLPPPQHVPILPDTSIYSPHAPPPAASNMSRPYFPSGVL